MEWARTIHSLGRDDAIREFETKGLGPEQIANLFNRLSLKQMAQQDGISSQTICNFLCFDNPYTNKCLVAFMSLQNFEGLFLDNALRAVIRKVGLPAAQANADRFLHALVQQYLRQNPTCKLDMDSAKLVARETILLNVKLHHRYFSGCRKRKVSKREFVAGLLEKAQGRDIPKEYLGSVYDRIRANRILVAPNYSRKGQPLPTCHTLCLAQDVKTRVRRKMKRHNSASMDDSLNKFPLTPASECEDDRVEI